MNIQSIEMPDLPSLYPLVKERIDFEALLQLAHAMLEVQANKNWTDTDEHDPGITLLQALSFIISDLAYRHTLPLQDLLTPEPLIQPKNAKEPGGLFPLSFGPNKTLTCSPITIDDYRRAILDLHSSDPQEASKNDSEFFYFRNVQLVPERGVDQYAYLYDSTARSFQFPLAEEITLLKLFGTYHLYVELAKENPEEGEEWEGSATKDVLDAFLKDNRNLCEKVRNITCVTPVEKNIQITVNVEDDAQNIARILARIYVTAQNYVRPLATRNSAQDLLAQGQSAENVYQGPQLQHGWITELPPHLDYDVSHTINISLLANALKDIEGIQSISTLSWWGVAGSSDIWEMQFDKGTYCQLWGGTPIETFLDTVILLKRGIKVNVIGAGEGDPLKTAFYDELDTLQTPLINEALVMLPYGNYRQPGRYYSASRRVPPCYGLQAPVQDSEANIQLHQFMVPFEQQLANSCDQLALLPALLSFDRKNGAPVWGYQWPFSNDVEADWLVIPNEVHTEYRSDLERLALEDENYPGFQNDVEKELAIIKYVLSYFGSQRSANILSDRDTFLQVQQQYLRRYSELAYSRAAIRIDEISSLQQRIAARLGLKPELFDPSYDRLGELPFYIVEHRELLPELPAKEYNGEGMKPDGVEVDNEEHPTTLTLTITLINDIPLKKGQLIDLVIAAGEEIRAVMVSEVNGNRLVFQLADHALLQNRIQKVLDAQETGTLTWKNCAIWLLDMEYGLHYAADQSGLLEKHKKISTTPYPVTLRVGDSLVFQVDSGARKGAARKISPSLVNFTAEVTEVNPLEGCFVAKYTSEEGGDFPPEADTKSYLWHIDQAQIDDRFSFKISVVFPRSLAATRAEPLVTADWIKRMVQEEIPAHISAQVHWFKDEGENQFEAFAKTYNSWQEDKTRLGDDSYELLKQLSIGMLPGAFEGIGVMHIRHPDDEAAIALLPDPGVDGEGWDTGVTNLGVFYVPRQK